MAALRASAPPGPDHDGVVRPGPSGIPPQSVGHGSAGPSAAPHNFSGFDSSDAENGELRPTPPRGSVLLGSATALGSQDTVAEDVDQQVASMVNFLFDKGMQADDYKAVAEDVVPRRSGNCTALAPVECNPQILGALTTVAK